MMSNIVPKHYLEVNRGDTINFSRISIASFANIIRYFLKYLLTFVGLMHRDLRYIYMLAPILAPAQCWNWDLFFAPCWNWDADIPK